MLTVMMDQKDHDHFTHHHPLLIHTVIVIIAAIILLGSPWLMFR
jgi:hypothetical protein